MKVTITLKTLHELEDIEGKLHKSGISSFHPFDSGVMISDFQIEYLGETVEADKVGDRYFLRDMMFHARWVREW